jgi:trigger factor
LKNQTINALISANSIDLPVSLIDLEVEALRKQTSVNNNEDIQNQIHARARHRVAASIIVGEIIRSYKLKADQERIKSLLEEFTHRQEDKHVKKTASYKKNKTVINRITSIALEEQALDLVLKEAKMTGKSFTFRELMNWVEKPDM